ncbi:MAG: hypothetical protein KAU58_06175, partial [Candidatus Omnitrophica bacterium]|nr:hypothetical protein [Candidatus Omnitrophota bacterium]
FSRVRNHNLVLVNSRGYGWSNYAIEIERPVNLDKHNITYTAKGQTGNEYLTLAIADVNNTSYRMEKDLSGVLTKEWKKYSIDFKSVKDTPLDIENVSVIKFEFGTLTVGNTRNATIFLKDIYLTKK